MLLGVATWLFFMTDVPFSTIAVVSVLGIFLSFATLQWSLGAIPDSGYAWRATAHHLIVELHASTPHELQPDCYDYSCQAAPEGPPT